MNHPSKLGNFLTYINLIFLYFNKCDPGKGVSNLYEMIFHKKKNQDDIVMLLGPGCSDVSSSVAEVANHWNLTVVRNERNILFWILKPFIKDWILIK